MELYIYKIENKVNNKVYIGKTNNIKRRTYQHRGPSSSLIGRAVKKYGWDNFVLEVIDRCTSEKEALQKETKYILKYNSLIPNGYNILLWDKKKVFHDTTKQIMSIKSQGIAKNNKSFSDYIGVSSSRNFDKYQCTITKDGQLFSKQFNTEIEASNAYDKLALFLYGMSAKLNFEKNRNKFNSESLRRYFDAFSRKRIKKSKYRFVSLKNNKYWVPYIYDKDKKQITLTSEKTEELAAIRADKCNYYLYRSVKKLNFPDRAKEYSMENLEDFYLLSLPIKTSKYKGVSFNKPSGKWTACICKNKKNIFLGYHLTEEEAYQARIKSENN